MPLQNSTIPIIGEEVGFVELANMFVALAIILAGALSVIYIFVGGISFILSAGQEDKIKSAVQTIRYAVIGLIVTIFAMVAVQIVGRLFGFDLIPYLSWEAMKNMITVIFERLTTNANSSQGGAPLG
ncbi:hypothetical protein HZA38_02470 [Candidatus Peregrinibacteria bacterium]|nr:hypothetical protein [Candidatus Peregrinibacteria bacterium]